MPLLTMITQQSLDQDYQVAAERRALGTPDPRGPQSRKVVAVVTLVFGVLVSTAFVQNRLSEDVENAGRRALIDRIDTQRDRVDDLQSEIADLRATNADLGETLAATSETQQTVDSQLSRLQVATGFVAVRGPGVRITVDNPPTGDEVIRDDDLHLLVNGLWSAGAEAIAINGERLTAMSAIRNSGVPILVNGEGVAPPYTVLAIGDTSTLQANLYDTSSGLAFAGLVDQFGFSFVMDNDDDLSLPAAPRRLEQLRTATAGSAADQSPKEEETGP
jgi:uncharacterized protein YlxW (UPF0749 family)